MKITFFASVVVFATVFSHGAEGQGPSDDFSSAFGRIPTMNKREALVIREARGETDPVKRIEILSDASAETWAGAAVFFNLANLEFSEGRHDAAISHYKKAIENTPAFFMAQKNLAFATDAKGDKKAAFTEMKKALALSGGSDPDILRWMSLYHGNLENFTAALWACSQALLYKPEDIPLKTMYAYLLYKTRSYHECVRICEKLLEVDSQNKEVLSLLSKARVELGDLNAALSALEILDRNSDASESDIRLYADILFNLKRYADSARAYARIKSDVGCSRAALALTAIGEYEEALKANSDENLKHKIKALKHFSEGDLKNAEMEVETYLNRVSGDLHAEYFRANVLAKLSEYESARLCFRKLLVFPEFRRGALTGIFHCSVGLGDMNDAFKTAKILEKEYPDNESEKYLKYFDLDKNETTKFAQ